MLKADMRGVVRFLVFVTLSAVGSAQSFVLNLPLPSQRAEVTQRVGITDIRWRDERCENGMPSNRDRPLQSTFT